LRRFPELGRELMALKTHNEARGIRLGYQSFYIQPIAG
jgi:hypothetical protein